MGVVVGCLYLDLFISEAQSLKDRRRVLKSFKERLHQKFPVATAEVGEPDLWQRAELAIVVVVPSRPAVPQARLSILRPGSLLSGGWRCGYSS